jgi:hypothetical protein
MIRLGSASIVKGRRLQFVGDSAVHQCAHFRHARTIDLGSVFKL